MDFKVIGSIEKILAAGSDSSLYSVIEPKGEKTKKWAVWISGALEIGTTYEISGYVSEYKDKKLKYEGGKDVWKTGFNATVFSQEFPF